MSRKLSFLLSNHIYSLSCSFPSSPSLSGCGACGEVKQQSGLLPEWPAVSRGPGLCVQPHPLLLQTGTYCSLFSFNIKHFKPQCSHVYSKTAFNVSNKLMCQTDCQQASHSTEPQLPECPEDGLHSYCLQPRALRHPQPAVLHSQPSSLPLSLHLLHHLTGTGAGGKITDLNCSCIIFIFFYPSVSSPVCCCIHRVQRFPVWCRTRV